MYSSPVLTLGSVTVYCSATNESVAAASYSVPVGSAAADTASAFTASGGVSSERSWARRQQGNGDSKGQATAKDRRQQRTGDSKGQATVKDRRQQRTGDSKGQATARERRRQGNGDSKGQATAKDRRQQGTGDSKGQATAKDRRQQRTGDIKGTAGIVPGGSGYSQTLWQPTNRSWECQLQASFIA
jgi:hypothetical protein